jgi:hypothetical protein
VATHRSRVRARLALSRDRSRRRAELDRDEAERATVAAAERLVARCPEVAEIVLECTNMPPYADAVRAATRLPVHDVTTDPRVSAGRQEGVMSSATTRAGSSGSTAAAPSPMSSPSVPTARSRP